MAHRLGFPTCTWETLIEFQASGCSAVQTRLLRAFGEPVNKRAFSASVFMFHFAKNKCILGSLSPFAHRGEAVTMAKVIEASFRRSGSRKGAPHPDFVETECLVLGGFRRNGKPEQTQPPAMGALQMLVPLPVTLFPMLCPNPISQLPISSLHHRHPLLSHFQKEREHEREREKAASWSSCSVRISTGRRRVGPWPASDPTPLSSAHPSVPAGVALALEQNTSMAKGFGAGQRSPWLPLHPQRGKFPLITV